MDFLEGLNPQQREAVCHLEGPLLILAGAGSGKTRVITHRIARLVGVERVPGDAVLAVTFTNKAADEMRERVLALLGAAGAASRPWVSTFHSFSVRLLRRDGAPLADLRSGFTPSFTIYDEDDQLAAVKSVYRRLALDDSFMQYRAAISRISFAKNHKQSPADLYKTSTDPKTSRLASVYEEYENSLRQANALDFDDLLLESVRLLQHDETVRTAYNRRFAYLMIDEYQDTNRSQYELMRLLTVLHQNVCVVGDEDQSIYGWRGADIRNILDFEHDSPGARTIRLEQNYRSTSCILEAASALVSRNLERKGKWLWTERKGGEMIGVAETADGEQEALLVASLIQRALNEDASTRVAVLYRTNAQSRQLEEALRRHTVPYHVVSGFSFYQRAEIRDALAYLKVLISPDDSVSLLRIINTPARGIGRSTLEQVERYGKEHRLSAWTSIGRMLEEHLFPTRAQAALAAFRNMIVELRNEAAREPVHAVLRLVLDRTGLRKGLEADQSPDAESRLENLDELVNAAAEASERGESIAEFLDHAALVSDSDQLDGQAQVSLLTLHNAKGLEFPMVFMTGMEEGLAPHSRSFESAAMLEEERRLCYVGMTRAERRLILTWARARRRFGGGSLEPSRPSRFLGEIPPKLTQSLTPGMRVAEVDLFLDRHLVRESVQRTTYTGKTYNSLDHIRQYFASRGETVAAEAPKPPAPKPKRAKGVGVGSVIEHPRWGRGTIVRREGEGDEAKLTVSFPGYGLKKLVQKYAGLKTEE
ncbi:MAG TPA: UvrD-helicase domain-containing protein [Bryobacteraceae bacterium]|nr:UvrD-helicase domain-containing protein [Bryobacteraceae bacterium]